MPEWATLTIVAVAGWTIVSVSAGMVVGRLFRRLSNKSQMGLLQGPRWHPY
jgi:hypothetical protein